MPERYYSLAEVQHMIREAEQRALQAARDAVAALDICPECSVDEALAAIDALRSDTASRISTGYDPAATENRP